MYVLCVVSNKLAERSPKSQWYATMPPVLTGVKFMGMPEQIGDTEKVKAALPDGGGGSVTICVTAQPDCRDSGYPLISP